MNISEIMKTGTYVPATFEIKGNVFPAAYPFPLLHVDINDERILITAPLQKDVMIAYPKNEEINLSFHQVKTIRVHAQKWYGGPLWKRYNDDTNQLFRFPIIVDIECKDHTVYRFRNNALMMIYDIYQIVQNKDITFVDEKNLMEILKDIDKDQKAFQIDIEIAQLLCPMVEQFDIIS